MADERLAAVKDDIEQIMVAGPAGTWTNPPSTFPFSSETIEFQLDGTGRLTRFSTSESEPYIFEFEWKMVERGQLRIGTRDMPFEMVVQPTEFSDELMMVTVGMKIFDFDLVSTPLVRVKPRLKLPRLPYRPTPWSDFWTGMGGGHLRKIFCYFCVWLGRRSR